MLIFGYVMLAISVSGILYGINDVFIEDDDTDAAPEGEDPVGDDAGDLLDDDPQPDDSPADDEAPDDVDDDQDTPADTGNAVPAEALDFLTAPGTTLSFIADQPVTADTETVTLAAVESAGAEAQDFQVEILDDAGALLRLSDPAASTYVVGGDGDDTVEVSGGLAISNLGAGNDIYSDDGVTGVSGPTFLGQTGADGGLVATAAVNALQRVFAGDGNDTLDVRAAGGLIYGGDGDDEITSGAANAYVRGGDGSDQLMNLDAVEDGNVHWMLGDDGSDTVIGGDDQDVIYGDGIRDSDGASTDSLLGGGGNDVIRGGQGEDTIDGGQGDDTIHGYGNANLDLDAADVGVQFIWNGDGAADSLIGGSGNDMIFGDQYDTMEGGIGADVFTIAHDTTVTGDGTTAVINDFDTGSDELRIMLDPSQLPEGMTEAQFDPEITEVDGNTIIGYQGVPLAILNQVIGVTPADISITISVQADVAAPT